MRTYVVFCYINFDGIGDFTHYEGVMQKLECYQDIQFVSIILFNAQGKHENFLKIQEKLHHYKGAVYYGKEDAHQDIFTQDPVLIEYLNNADQAFYISYKGSLGTLYDRYLKPNIPIKYIGEHDVALYMEEDLMIGKPKNPYCFNRSLGLGKDYFGNPCQGIKLLETPPTKSFQEQWELITEKDPAFSARVLACTHSSDATALQQHTFIAAYFNRCWDFFEFLRIFTVNMPEPAAESVIIHYSGNDLFKFMEAVPVEIAGHSFVYPEKTPYLEKLFNQGHIKELELLSPDPTQILRINGSGTGTVSVKILTGFYLSDSSLQSLYQLSKMVAVSGDNTLELAISMSVLPFYCSTNWDSKRRTLIALREITQSPELDISPTARQSFNVFFDQYSIQTRSFTDLLFPQHDRNLQLNLYATLDFPSMIDAWPKVADYIRLHHNFYDRLDSIVREGLSADLQPKIETTPSNAEQTTISQTPQTFFSAEPNQMNQSAAHPTTKDEHDETRKSSGLDKK